MQRAAILCLCLLSPPASADPSSALPPVTDAPEDLRLKLKPADADTARPCPEGDYRWPSVCHAHDLRDSPVSYKRGAPLRYGYARAGTYDVVIEMDVPSAQGAPRSAAKLTS